MKLKTLSVVLLGLVALTAHANPTDQKALCQQLTTELGAFVDGFIAMAPQEAISQIKNSLPTLPIIIASWESIKQAGERVCTAHNPDELAWFNFSLQEILTGIKRATLKLHLLDPEISPVGFSHIGNLEHYRIMGDVYAYMLSWLQRQCIQPTHVLMVIDNKTVSTLIRASARKSFRWWWIMQNIRLARNIFEIDLYESAPRLVDEYFAFIKTCNSAAISNDVSIEQIVTASKILLAHCVDTKAEFERDKDHRTTVIIDVIMNSVTLTCQKLTDPLPQEEKPSSEQILHRLISDLYSGNWASKNIIQPLIKKYGVSILQYLLNTMKETPQQTVNA